MTVIDQRYNRSWYDKRIKQNQQIKNFLIDKIFHHKEKDFVWTREELFSLNYEDLFEIAVTTANKDISITLGEGKDWNCGSDGKVTIARVHSNGASYAAGIKVKNKKYVRALVYEGIQEKFYFFGFPVKMPEHSVPFDVATGNPKRYTKQGPNIMWTYWECKTFEEMALK
jgi:hypothetical protein